MRVLLTMLAILAGAGAAVFGLFVMSWGGTVAGLVLFGGGLLWTMAAAGAGMPRPRVVPRPGEESEYIRGD